jgi:aldehyde:ferredoxin oxidoreductase
MTKVIRVNTRTGRTTSEEFKKEYQFFGNRGLIAKVMTDEVNPKCDPLGKENKLIMSTGIFAGTPLSTANRLSVGGKSPLTGTIKETNVGGNVGYMLIQHGIRLLIFEDIPGGNDWKMLVIDKSGKAELVPAGEYAGLNNYALVEKLKGKYGKNIAVASIGLAGERGYLNSSVQITDASTGYPSRAAARGGMGAVMGAKRIKAVVVQPAVSRYAFEYADKNKFDAANKRLNSFLLAETSPMGALAKFGTISFVANTASMGIIPVRNYSGELFDSKRLDKLSGPAVLKKQEKRGGKNGLACQPGCLIRCNATYNDSKGNYLADGVEYETIAMCGTNCDIDDIDTIAKISYMCDDLGLDTIETGATIGVCMEAGKIPWGDKKGALNLVKEMVKGTEFGNLMGKGTAAVGIALGVKRIPVVKGQSLSGYEPRNAPVTGVTFATTPMGADHTAGVMMMPNADLMPKLARLSMSNMMQGNMATCDNIMCMYAFMSTMGDPTILPDLFSGAFGGEWDAGKITNIGRQTINMEREFNKAAGFTQKDDCLPDFFYKEVAPSTGAIFDLTSEDMASIFQ